MDLVYCAARSRQFAAIAVAAGYRYGAQLPGFLYHAPWFVDQDWKHPDRAAYIAALAVHRPVMATVMDWEREDQLPEVLGWAEDAAPFVERILLVPKVPGQTHRLPRVVGGRPVVLAYSVPTRYGGTSCGVWEFAGWPVHLLGGQPHAQLLLARYLRVLSADGSYHQRVAKYGKFWIAGGGRSGGGHWATLQSVGDARTTDVCYEAFRRSCVNIRAAWRDQAKEQAA